MNNAICFSFIEWMCELNWIMRNQLNYKMNYFTLSQTGVWINHQLIKQPRVSVNVSLASNKRPFNQIQFNTNSLWNMHI